MLVMFPSSSGIECETVLLLFPYVFVFMNILVDRLNLLQNTRFIGIFSFYTFAYPATSCFYFLNPI